MVQVAGGIIIAYLFITYPVAILAFACCMAVIRGIIYLITED